MVIIRGIVFDLDDTLYLERDFVRSGFMAVATKLQETACLSRDVIFSYLWGLFEQGVRGDTFDRLLNAHPGLRTAVQVSDLVWVYRRHTPRITLLPDARELLNRLRARGFRLGLLSDGSLDCQQAKVRALELEGLFSPITLTDRWGQQYWKPHPRGYREFTHGWGLAPAESVYVADNPAKDFVTPRALGWQTIRLRMSGQLRSLQEAVTPDHAAAHEVSSLAELEDLLLGTLYAPGSRLEVPAWSGEVGAGSGSAATEAEAGAKRP